MPILRKEVNLKEVLVEKNTLGLSWRKKQELQLLILAENNYEELALASSKSAATDSSIDRTNFIFVTKKALSPDKAKDIRRSMFIQEPVKMKNEDALGLKIQCDLSE